METRACFGAPYSAFSAIGARQRTATRRGTFQCLLAAAFLLSLSSTASAELYLGAAPGGIVPWQDNPDLGRALVDESTLGSRVRVGAEVEVRDFELTLLERETVPVSSYDARAVIQFVAFPRRISPYIGVGAGFEFVKMGQSVIARGPASLDLDRFGVGAGGSAFMGVHVPIGARFSAFAEGRAGFALEVTERFDEALDRDDLGAYSGFAGLRYSF